MGSADIIPGVSGGTIALITGIYEKLIYSLEEIDFKFIPYFFEGKFVEMKRDFKKIDFGFFTPLVLGIGTAFLILSKIMHLLLNGFPISTYSFFFGLILASSFLVYEHVREIDLKTGLFVLIGFVFSFYLTGLGIVGSIHSLPVVFGSGIIAICAMILPGVSGAFILLFLGQYEYMLSALNQLNLVVIVTFILGALVGMFSISQALSYLLKHHKPVTMSFLVGLVLGALRLPLIKLVEVGISSFTRPIFFGIVGMGVVLILEKFKKINI